jgi:hypothetical protein
MNAIKEAIARLLRGPRVSGLLERLGIDPRRFWLLMDLFDLISERGEMMDQLGREGVALNTAVIVYGGMSVLFSLVFVLTHMALAAYLTFFLGFSALLLVSVLMSETGNSLVNPVEGLVLVHQPINGATYSSAKLSHLLRIILFLVPALNGVPALAGLLLKTSRWYYPFLHLGAAFTVGLVSALLCCALFGWLIRFVPVRRLKAAGQLASTLPFMTMMWIGQMNRLIARLDVSRWLPAQTAARWGLAAGIGLVTVAAVVLGLRSLSADYLLRVSSLMRGGASAGSGARRSLIGAIVSRFFGGQAGRAGYAFVSRMMLRDWQYRRALIPLLFPALFGIWGIVKGGWPADPFSGEFTRIHLLPHTLGTLLFFIITVLPYGSDYKGAWIFLLAPSRALAGFAWGIYALLWIWAVVIPNLLVLPLLAWLWGIPHAGLFIAYSIAAASIYLAVELRMLEDIPFSKQADSTRGATLLPLMMLGGVVIAIAVGLQYYFVFRSPVIVAWTTIVLGLAAYLATRASVGTMTASMRFHLGVVTAEIGSLYKEVGA